MSIRTEYPEAPKPACDGQDHLCVECYWHRAADEEGEPYCALTGDTLDENPDLWGCGVWTPEDDEDDW